MVNDPALMMMAIGIGLLIGALLGVWWGGRARGAEHAGRVAAEARLAALSDEIERLREAHRVELAAAQMAERAEREARAAAEQAAALARQQAAATEAKMADWAATRDEFLKSTKAGVLETAQQISSKLLEDHKRETEAAKLESQALVKATTEQLAAQVKEVGDGVSQLKGQVAEKGQQLDTVMRALSSPAGAGYFAELGLANTLRGFGLLEQRDFVLQASVNDEEGARKRPDAIVFLPGDGLLVIDAKASKHLMALAESEGAEREDEAYKALGRTMNQHLRDLTTRDYQAAVTAEARRRKGGEAGAVSRILTIMYVPNEAALEKLARADADFMRKAAEARITPVGPAGLASLIGFASVEISLQRQIENQERIAQAAEQLLDSLATAIGHATSVGKGLRTAAEYFGKFSASLNGRVLPRAREMERLGLRPAKKVPANLGAYQVLDLSVTIEGEAVPLDADGSSDPALAPPVS